MNMELAPTAPKLIMLPNSKAKKEQLFAVRVLAELTETATLMPAEPMRIRKVNI